MTKTAFLNTIRRIAFRNRVSELLLYQLSRGRSLDSPLARLAANYYQYPKNSFRQVRRNGIRYRLDISDYMEWLIFFDIRSASRDALFGLVKKGMTVADVGANVGETTLSFARMVGSTGRVYSFEPSDHCFRALRHNISLNSFSNIVINKFGLGAKEESFYLAPEVENNRGGGRVKLNSEMPPNVYIQPLDTFMKEAGIASLDLIKIDVEGFEHNVLLGAEETIRNMRPALFIELNDHNLRQQNSSAKALLQFLEKYYSNIHDAENGERISSGDQLTHHTDIIARR